MEDLELKLDRIRVHVNSKLENQKSLAVILGAVEDNIQEQGNELSPTAYFVSFLALLDQSLKDDEIVEMSLATSASYFLDLVMDFVPKPLLRVKFSDILIKIASILNQDDISAPIIRPCVGALEKLLIAQDSKAWQSKLNISPWTALSSLLELALDGRPKIRKRAQEAIFNILSNPPPSPTLGHVAGNACSDFALKSVVEVLNSSQGKKNESNPAIIHNLQLIETIASSHSWNSSKIEPLCDILLEISKTNDQYLVSATFSVFQSLFNSLQESIYLDKLLNVLQILFDLKPSINDSRLVGAWVAVIDKGIETFVKLDDLKSFSQYPQFFKILGSYLSSENSDIYTSASNCLMAMVSYVPDELLLLPPAVSNEKYEKVDEIISKLAEIVTDLLSVKYSHCAKEVMMLLSSLLTKLRFRSNPDFITPFEIVGSWRTEEESASTLNLKDEEDLVVSSAITNLGAEVVLSSLPLNLQSKREPGRAWLLPLLRDNVRCSSLNFYKKQILPLAKVFQEKSLESAKLDANSTIAKIFETIYDQIWSLLPHFCDLPNDLRSAFDNEFAEFLTNQVNGNVNLRTTVCHALKMLVESNLVYSEGVLKDDVLLTQRFPITESEKNIKHLSKMAGDMISVLFNLFATSNPDTRGYILETIDLWLRIAPVSEIEEKFNSVCVMLQDALQKESEKSTTNRLSVTMMDLIVCISSHLPESSYNALFSIFNLTNAVNDNLIQKRSYKIIKKLSEVENGRKALLSFISDIVSVILGNAEKCTPGAKLARLQAVQAIVTILPQEDLYFIPSIVSEIILSTKDVNEKTRNLAYELLIQMGKKMNEGGVIDNSKIPGFDANSPKVPATLNEYFTIISAGLAGNSPHMISATITTISCLVYEFVNDLPAEFLEEISSTMELFLTSNNREIVKSTIGFVKVEVLSLPVAVVEPKLQQILEYLMRWSHEHKGHFKLRVRHIIERLIRKFGYEAVEKFMPEEDMKLLVNIKKTKLRKKRKQETETEESSSKETVPDKKFASAYEKVLYDSGDEEDEELDEKPEVSERKGKSKQYIIESNDPLNLLDRQAFAHISSTKPRTEKSSKKGKFAEKFESQNGKLVFEDNEESELEKPSEESAVNAYLDAVKQGPIRGQRNRLKYKRGRTNIEEEFSDDEEKPKKSNKPKPYKNFKNGGRNGNGHNGRVRDGRVGKGRR